MTDAEVKSALASLAANEIAAFSSRVEKILRSMNRDWPEAMCNSEVAPSVAFLLFSALEGLQEKAAEVDELAREASGYDEEYARSCRGALEATRRPGAVRARIGRRTPR